MKKQFRVILEIYASYYTEYRKIYSEYAIGSDLFLRFIRFISRYTIYYKRTRILNISLLFSLIAARSLDLRVSEAIIIYIVNILLSVILNILYEIRTINRGRIPSLLTTAIVTQMNEVHGMELNKEESELYNQLEDIYMAIIKNDSYISED